MKHVASLTIILMVTLLALSPTTFITSAQEDPVPWSTEGWQTSAPEKQGLDSEELAALITYLQEQDDFNIDSLLIIRNGYVVTDAYFYPFTEGSLHDLASVTKSFTSTLVGIAIDQGAIEGVEQPVLNFFPTRSVANLDANKEAMTLEDLLTMRSGFECISQDEFTLSEMRASPDWVQFALDLPMTTEPGTRFAYCSPNPHLLSGIIHEVTGMSALEYAHEHLFAPLGITNVIWPTDPQGNNWGWGDLKLSPDDMAKLGYLFLNEGLWDGQQVVSTEWVEAATSPLTPAVGGSDYGYQWWVNPSGGYYEAAGYGGQQIYVLPDLDMIVVLTGVSGGGGPGAWGEQLLESRIIPLAESPDPLPDNPDGAATLAAVIQAVGAPVEIQPQPVPPLPDIAQQVSGLTYVMEPNPVGLVSGSLTFEEEAEAVLRLTFAAGPDETMILEWLIGMDNVPRISPGLTGLSSAATGAWESDSVFCVLP